MQSRRVRKSLSIASQSLELAMAVPEVMAHRMLRLWLAGPFPSRHDRGEFHRMGAEKIIAFHESWNAIFMSVFEANLRLALSPVWAFSWMAAPRRLPSLLTAHSRRTGLAVVASGLKPIHRRAVANARRLRAARR